MSVAARRAVVRWSWRMFRREWRQQLLVLTLLTVAVAAAVCSITIAHNTSPAEDAEFGSASGVLTLDGSDERRLEDDLAYAKRRFGTIEAIPHRSVAVPGSVETFDFRAQQPDGVYGAKLLGLRSGRYPIRPHEAAVTDGVADLLQLELGSTLALDGRRRTVVGVVENPRKLSDEFALVPPSSAGAPDHVTVLVGASEASFRSFARSRLESGDSSIVRSATRPNARPVDALAMFSVATVFLLLASLVGAAGFAVVAQRRLRQLGILAATGATPKHVRLVLLTNGAAVGALAALAGTIVGIVVWAIVAPTLESAIDHRVDTLSVPWGLVAMTAFLALVAATAAAWWPGRAVSRLPVTIALSGRPPRPRPARNAAITSAVLIGVGIGCLALSDRDKPPLIVAGIVSTILGCLLLGPSAIRIFSRVAGHVSIASRLALRDLVRYQARSGAALAAVTLALGIAATVVVVASAEEAKAAARPPSLSDRQLRVYLGPTGARDFTPVGAPRQLEGLAAQVREIAARLDGATVVPVDKAFQPGAVGPVVEGVSVFPTIELTRRTGRHSYNVARQLYVATPALLRYLEIDPASVAPSADFLADPGIRINGFVIPSFKSREEFAFVNVQRVETGRRLLGNPWGDWAAGQKPVLITLAGLRRRGWDQVASGWVVESSRPLTSEQIAAAREVAARAGLTIDVQRDSDSQAKVMTIATAAGAFLALGILALTVGLIRGESAGDLRTLTATGATPGIRRTLTGTTAGALALLGAVLGVAGAYIVLTATYHDDLGYLSHVPFRYLALAVIGVPLAAAAAGWLIAGREPPAIARTVIG